MMIHRRIATVAILLGLAGASPVSMAFAGGSTWCKGEDPPPQCRTPEAPLPIGLPLAGLVVAGGYVFLVRRQHNLPDRS